MEGYDKVSNNLSQVKTSPSNIASRKGSKIGGPDRKKSAASRLKPLDAIEEQTPQEIFENL